MSVSVSSAPVFSMTQGYNEKVWMTVCVLLPTLSPSPRLSLSKSVSDDRVLCWFLSVQELMLMTLSLLKVVFWCVWSVCVLRELAGQHTCSWDWISSNVRLDSADPVAWELTNTFQWQLWSADHLQRGEEDGVMNTENVLREEIQKGRREKKDEDKLKESMDTLPEHLNNRRREN